MFYEVYTQFSLVQRERGEKRLKHEPAPYFHCATRRMRKILYEAYLWFVAAYREAAEMLKAGQLDVAFPEGCFPPPRPLFRGSWIEHFLG